MHEVFKTSQHKRDANGNIILRPAEEFIDYIRFDSRKVHELLGKEL